MLRRAKPRRYPLLAVKLKSGLAISAGQVLNRPPAAFQATIIIAALPTRQVDVQGEPSER